MIVYSKINPQRKKEFQLRTFIIDDGGKFYVIKKAENKEAELFSNNFIDKYKLLLNNNFPIKPIEPKDQGGQIIFPYEEGDSVSQLLLRLINSNKKEEFLDVIRKFYDTLKGYSKENLILSDDFVKIFGKCGLEKWECIYPGCVDLNFDNIIADGDGSPKKLFDYEWTYNFSVPYKYIVFRAIMYFYVKNHGAMYSKFSLMELFDILEISKEEIPCFLRFEYSFQCSANNGFEKSVSFDEYKDAIGSVIKSKNSGGDSLFKKYEAINLEKINLAAEQRKQEIKMVSREIKQKDNMIEKKNEEIEFMRSSKFWKLRKQYLDLKNLFIGSDR